MKIQLIKAPTDRFLEMLLGNIRSSDRGHLAGVRYGAVGLVQTSLINLYRAADLAEKASNVKTALVFGNCPQHIQILAIFGKHAEVNAALDKVREIFQK